MTKNKGSEDIPAEALKGLELSRTMMQQAIDLKDSLPKGLWEKFKVVDASLKSGLPGGQLWSASEGMATLKKIHALREGIMKAYEGNALQKQEVDRLLAALPDVEGLNGLSDNTKNADSFLKVASEVHGSRLKTMQMGLPKHDFSQELADYEVLQRKAGTKVPPTFKPVP